MVVHENKAVLETAGQGGKIEQPHADSSALPGAFLPISAEYHDPIIQQVVLLARAEDNPAARDLLAFVRGPIAQTIIQAHGYRFPTESEP